ncbi:hypothetical protein [Marinobacterium arenosum]|uniref:hypothetical protein n=1 Tax=Marinobacterium arenosum TaxID=2862496 RepID=UPI001C972338|nr:hypothetical protein [Marinobacterium arenosum]MBY4676945.1 hypothetical protein [Marinobacterium arenosum]
MQRALVLIIVLLVAAAAFMFYQRSEQTGSVEDTRTAPPSAETARQAREHIDRLTSPAEQAIDIEQAEHFVTAQQLLALPAHQVEASAELLELNEAGNQTEPLAGDAASGDTTSYGVSLAPLPGKTAQPPSRDTLDQIQGQIQNGTLPQRAHQVKLKELLDNPDAAEKQIFYLHAVREGDSQGLWGIIQHALMRTFSAGLKLPGQQQAVSTDIPADADERLADLRSSFLGNILQNKVDETYIYNYAQGILGQNPDLIRPGQQLIIVTFSEQELIDIYRHFMDGTAAAGTD